MGKIHLDMQRRMCLLAVTALMTACGGGGNNNASPQPPPSSYSVGGAISGLTASGLVIQNNAADNLTISANAGNFVFTTNLLSNASYDVSIKTQPVGMSCSLTNTKGVVAGAIVTNVGIECVPLLPFAVGGSISGLTAGGLVLQVNGTQDISINRGTKTFVFPTPLIRGTGYTVSIKSQPSWQSCAISNAVGVIAGEDAFRATLKCVNAVALVEPFSGVWNPTSTAYGHVDGNRLTARYYVPMGLAMGSDGTIYVADSANHSIRAIQPDGVVRTLAGGGSPGGSSSGYADGTGSAALFNMPLGVAVDKMGTVYVSDTFNNLIRKVTPAGVVTTLAGGGSPGGIAAGSENGVGFAARFNGPSGIAVDDSGSVFVSDEFNHLIRKVTATGSVSTYAGGGSSNGTANGHADGIGTAATFFQPAGLALDGLGNLYVADALNNAIRKIAFDRNVTTYAGGLGSNVAGSVDGPYNVATFDMPFGIAIDATGSIFVTDYGNRKVRLIDGDGNVSTLAGTGNQGTSDGVGTAAGLSNPYGIAVARDFSVYFADSGSSRIRKLTPMIQP